MTSPAVLATLLLVPCLAEATPSALGIARFSPPRESKGLLAQRTIEREWPVRGDSGVVTPPPGARSPIAAMALSAAVPGAGQVYAGRRRAALGYAAVEVAGWVGWALLQRGSERLRDDATALAGAPGDSASAWSFDRLQDVTGVDATELRALYAADREAFHDAIGRDSRYAAGWFDASSQSRFNDLRRRSDRKLEGARWTSAGLWVNHVVAAVEALRGVRLGNLNVDLGNRTELRAKGRLQRGRPSFLVTLERRF